MNPGEQRRGQILARLQADGRLSVADLAGAFRVSDETVRRDLKELEDRGLLRRVHGGAVMPSLLEGRSHGDRSKVQRGAKERIAAKALGFVRSGMSLFVDYGTTTQAFGRRLAGFDNLTVMTSSLPLAQHLVATTAHRVVLTGGDLDAVDSAVTGEPAREMVRAHYFDLAVMGTRAIDAEHGFMDFREDDSVLLRLLVKHARFRLMLSDSTKFGRQGFVRTFGFEAIDALVTDRTPAPEFIEALDKAKVELVV
jgi:DeoR family glycerol-3-phosphate regulon repressor